MEVAAKTFAPELSQSVRENTVCGRPTHGHAHINPQRGDAGCRRGSPYCIQVKSLLSVMRAHAGAARRIESLIGGAISNLQISS